MARNLLINQHQKFHTLQTIQFKQTGKDNIMKKIFFFLTKIARPELEIMTTKRFIYINAHY